MYLQQARMLYEQLGERQPPAACTPEEVSALEQRLGLSLPAAYKEFLLWMGRGAGYFMKGMWFYYQDLPLQQQAAELLARYRFPHPLPADAFVFFMSQGYTFSFLRVTEGDDPPVYSYRALYERLCFALRFRSHSDSLVHELERYAEAKRAHPEKYQPPAP